MNNKDNPVPSLTEEQVELIKEALTAYGVEDEEYIPIEKVLNKLYGVETKKS